ncbi:hypothetical protein D4R52_03210 [bacterium]|nr:MAG: hypothetical protein D4R52_03210 [bacterium]
MAPLADKFKQMEEIEFPSELHDRILACAWFSKFRIAIYTILSLLGSGLVISGWWIWERIVEVKGIAILQKLIYDFEMDYAHVTGFLAAVWTYLPIGPIAVFLVNLAAVIFIISLTKKIRLLTLKNNPLFHHK